MNYIGVTWSTSWGDTNGDGLQDIFVSNHGTGQNKFPTLYINQGDGTFLQRAEQFFSYKYRDFHGSSWADFDNDGDLDIFISSGGSRGALRTAEKEAEEHIDDNVFWVQNESGYQDEVKKWGLRDRSGRGRSPIWYDVNRDGKLDIFLTKAASDRDEVFLYTQAENTFLPCTSDLLNFNKKHNLLSIYFRRLFSDDALYTVANTRTPLASIYQHLEDCQFRNITKFDAPGGIDNVEDMAIEDFTGNLRPEIFMVRMGQHSYELMPEPNRLILQKFVAGESVQWSFKTEGNLRRVRISPLAKGYWTSDRIYIGSTGYHPTKRPFPLRVDNELNRGLADIEAHSDAIAIGYDKQEDRWRVIVKRDGRYVRTSIVITSAAPIDYDTKPLSQAERGRAERTDHIVELSRNGFVDVSENLQLTASTSCTSVTAADFDNDMDLDLYLGCRSEIDNPPNRLYENIDGKAFHEVALSAEAQGLSAGVADRVTSGDYDNDGFIDLFITNGYGAFTGKQGPVQLLHNSGNTNNWLKLNLVGSISPKSAYGARIFLTAGGKTQVRNYSGGTHTRAQDDIRAHFGLADNLSVENLVVEWPSGLLEKFQVSGINSIIDVIEGSGELILNGIIMLPYTNVELGKSIDFLALFPSPIDLSTIRWRIANDELHGCVACTYTFSRAGRVLISVEALTENNKKLSSNISLLVTPPR